MLAEIITDKLVKGQRQITVAAPKGGKFAVMLIAKNGMFQLGGQMDDVVPDHVLAETSEVRWDHHSQEWEVVGAQPSQPSTSLTA